MYNLFILNENFTNGLNYNVLNIISFISLLSGILVVISNNPIVSVLFLIGLFLNIAGYLMLLGINFIGLSYLLVYVGAVSILFLFILMLINVRISELVTDNNNSVPLGFIIGIFFNIILYNSLIFNKVTNNFFFYIQDKSSVYKPSITGHNSINNNVSFIGGESNYLDYWFNNLTFMTSNDLYFVSSHTWDGALAEVSHITSIGNVIYSVYPIWLIITSIILLLAMVGAIVITIKQ